MLNPNLYVPTPTLASTHQAFEQNTGRLYGQIAKAIATRIRGSEFAAGDALPAEASLAKALNVPHVALREALVALEVFGLVEIRPDGVYVLPQHTTIAIISEVGLENGPVELLRARRMLECEVAALAAENASNEQIEVLLQCIDEMQTSLHDHARFCEHDHRFHLLLARATGSHTLRDLVEHLWKQRYSPLHRKFEAHYGGEFSASLMVDDHYAIVTALQARDPNAARTAMREHLGHVLANFIR